MRLTAHLITKNNETIVEDTIKSLWRLGDINILVGDLGSTDKTVRICREYGADVRRLQLKDYSQVRNELLVISNTPWQFIIHPGEVLVAGHEEIRAKSQEDALRSYQMQVFQGELIIKDIRLWSKGLRYRNPVYESVVDKSAVVLDTPIIFVKTVWQSEEALGALVEKWKKDRPTSHEPYYYQAHILLGQRKYKEFLSASEHYLFHEKQGMPSVMMRYHRALVQLYAMNESRPALKNILECIATQPLMAEFWCLLGDIYYKAGDYKKAMAFYENAITLGSRRLRTDDWPIEIPKYKTYPEKMINSCKEILSGSKFFGAIG